ncbi:MAG: ABC transporter substrate-binding protein [Candidatus Methylumidiphilus sp.]
MIKYPALLFSVLFSLCAHAEPADSRLKIGLLAFGSVNWETEAIALQGLDKKYGLDLQVQKLAGPDAGKIGLQGDSLDMIATDWIWVASQNQNGADYRFIPYSTQAGAVMVAADSTIRTLADLKGKKLGVAGGPLDKNWILLQAYAKKTAHLDLAKEADIVFGAPPLLNQQLADGKLDALLDFWHFAARLEAQGFRRLLDGRDVVKGLGINQPMPNLGFVFKQSWAATHGKALEGFRKASAEAQGLLCNDAAVWQKIAPLTQETDPQLQAALRKEYCAGLVKQWGDSDKQATAKIYTVIRETAGPTLTGPAEKLPETVFWQ